MQTQSPRNKSVTSASSNKSFDVAIEPAAPVERPCCGTCGYYDADDDRCRKDPHALDRKPSDWCGQHTDFPDYLASLKSR